MMLCQVRISLIHQNSLATGKEANTSQKLGLSQERAYYIVISDIKWSNFNQIRKVFYQSPNNQNNNVRHPMTHIFVVLITYVKYSV